MNNSILNCNQLLNQAYHQFQESKLQSALQTYQKALKICYSEHLIANIRCTMSIILHAQGKYQQSMDVVAPIIENTQIQEHGIVGLRVLVNLTLIEILEGRQQRAKEYFNIVMEIIKRESLNKQQSLLQYVSYLFFRVRKIAKLGQQIENVDVKSMNLTQVLTISMIAFNSQVLCPQTSLKTQKQCYEYFIKANRYDFALFSLRSIIKNSKNTKDHQYYQKQSNKLAMLGYFNQQTDYNNFQSYQTIQAIVAQIKNFSQEIQSRLINAKNTEYDPSFSLSLWKLTIASMKQSLKKNVDISSQVKKYLMSMLDGMKHESNLLLIQNLQKNKYFQKQHQIVNQKINFLLNFSKRKSLLQSKQAFDKINKQTILPLKNLLTNSNQNKQKQSLSHARSKSHLISTKDDKENLGISIVSISSSKRDNRRKIFNEDDANRKISKMIKLIEHGTFLNKRNYNSEGGEFKFVKINKGFIKWGKDPQKIESNCQIYPLKDIRSLIYGRVSPNLNQHYNLILQQSKCFSLLLNSRTLDFYCQKYDQLQAWVCGLSHVLKKRQQNIVGYTPGKLKWKKMFALLRQNFTEPMKLVDRNKYNNETAYAVIMFGKNNYQLPTKTLAK